MQGDLNRTQRPSELTCILYAKQCNRKTNRENQKQLISSPGDNEAFYYKSKGHLQVHIALVDIHQRELHNQK